MTIIIVVYNQKVQLELCLNAIRLWGVTDQLCSPLRTLIVDNASEDGTADWLALQTDVAYAVTESREPYAKIANEAVDLVGEDDILLWNPAYILTPGCLGSMERLINTDQQIGAVSVMLLYLRGKTKEQLTEGYEKAVSAAITQENIKNAVYVEMLDTQILLIRKGLFSKVGKLSEKCLTDKMVLEEWLIRVKQQGFVLARNESVQAYQFFKELLIEDGMKGSILLLRAGNAIIRYTCQQIGQAYRRYGYQVYEFDMKGLPEKTSELEEIIKGGVSYAFVLNNFGWFINQMNKNVWELYGIPCINFLFDHPSHSFQALKEAPKNGIVVCVDRKHVNMVRKYFPEISQCVFMPLGGQDISAYRIWKPWNEREIDVLYLGGYKDLKDLSLTPFQEIIVAEMKKSPDRTIEEIIEIHGARDEAGAAKGNIRKLIEENCSADWYMKLWIRAEVVKHLLDGNIKVDVCGGGWENAEFYTHPNLHCHGDLSQLDCLEMIRNSRIILNVMPNFRDGTHDRVINAMLGGAVALTDNTLYMQESFIEGKDYAAYSLKELHKLPELVGGILENPQKAEAMTKRAYQKAAVNHTWDARVKELMKELS